MYTCKWSSGVWKFSATETVTNKTLKNWSFINILGLLKWRCLLTYLFNYLIDWCFYMYSTIFHLYDKCRNEDRRNSGTGMNVDGRPHTASKDLGLNSQKCFICPKWKWGGAKNSTKTKNWVGLAISFSGVMLISLSANYMSPWVNVNVGSAHSMKGK